jgi:hypothetical protein
MCGAEIFPIKPREIVGTGRTVTKAIAKLVFRIGTIQFVTAAYVLEANSGFRYDILIGRRVMKTYNWDSNWEDNTFKMTDPKTKAIIHVKAICMSRDQPYFLPKDLEAYFIAEEEVVSDVDINTEGDHTEDDNDSDVSSAATSGHSSTVSVYASDTVSTTTDTSTSDDGLTKKGHISFSSRLKAKVVGSFKKLFLLQSFIFKIIQSKFRYLISVNLFYYSLDHAVGT